MYSNVSGDVDNRPYSDIITFNKEVNYGQVSGYLREHWYCIHGQ